MSLKWSRPWVLPAALLGFELCLLGAAVSFHRLAGQSGGTLAIGSLFATIRGGIALCAAAGAVALAVAIGRQFRSLRESSPRRLQFAVVANLMVVAAVALVGELAVRFLSTPTSRGPVFACIPPVFEGFRLRPRLWEEVVAFYGPLVEKSAAPDLYIVRDDLLGWSVGKSRRSTNGLYFASAEGIRSGREGVAFAEEPRPRRRIALVGDSQTFGWEIRFEDSWGHQLEKLLGPGYQVLNFGVTGYGVDQAFLRYKRDVVPWKPEIVLFGILPHDVKRSMAVYCFLDFPTWEYPYSKPRFSVEGGELKLSNSPVLAPEEIFARESIHGLPFLALDPAYSPESWRRGVRSRLHLARLLFPEKRSEPDLNRGALAEEVRTVNAGILRAFERLATAEGSLPIAVYLPAKADFDAPDDPEGTPALARSVLDLAGIEVVDVTDAVRALPEGERHSRGDSSESHFSRLACTRIAERLAGAIRGKIPAVKPADKRP